MSGWFSAGADFTYFLKDDCFRPNLGIKPSTLIPAKRLFECLKINTQYKQKDLANVPVQRWRSKCPR